MRKLYLVISLSALWFLVLSNVVLAYLDPGTGGVLLNTIWPLIVAFFSALLVFFIKWFWKPIKSTFSKIFGKSG